MPMPILPDQIANSSILGLPILPLITDSFFGLVGMTIVLIFHGIGINHLIMRFERKTDANLNLNQYNRVFAHFYATFLFIAIVHICEIVLWCFYLLILGLVEDPYKRCCLQVVATQPLGLLMTFCRWAGKLWHFLLHSLAYFHWRGRPQS